jgi:hypothetical protein
MTSWIEQLTRLYRKLCTAGPVAVSKETFWKTSGNQSNEGGKPSVDEFPWCGCPNTCHTRTGACGTLLSLSPHAQFAATTVYGGGERFRVRQSARTHTLAHRNQQDSNYAKKGSEDFACIAQYASRRTTLLPYTYAFKVNV